jgi:sugar/nucleoside kinase (ribokinase family)
VSDYDYVAVGHVTCDVLEGAGGAQACRPGGSAFYGALQAARLGLRALIVTRGLPSQIERLLAPYRAEVDLRVIASAQTTTLATRGTGGERRQRVLAWAGAIDEPAGLSARIVHLAPVASETPSDWRGRAGFLGITPQGLLRTWTGAGRAAAPALGTGSAAADAPVAAEPAPGGGEIELVELDGALLPARFDAAVVSEQERPFCGALFAAARECGACVAVTAGAAPANVHLHASGSERVLVSAPPPAVQARDDLGAGDVFAAAFFVALAEGRDPLAAASLANAAAAVRIAGEGAAAIGTRAQIEALL